MVDKILNWLVDLFYCGNPEEMKPHLPEENEKGDL